MRTVDVNVCKIGVAEGTDDIHGDNLDCVLVPAFCNKEIDLEREPYTLKGFAGLYAAASATCPYPLFCGCKTKAGSIHRTSVFAFHAGKLIDIADRTVNLTYGGEREGDKLKVYRLSSCRMGLLIDTDLLLYGNWVKLKPHVDIVVSIVHSEPDDDFRLTPDLAASLKLPYAFAFADGSLFWGLA